MAGKPGRIKILEQFLCDGMNVMFGNPGTVEQGFLDSATDIPQMEYILTLQESVAVLMREVVRVLPRISIHFFRACQFKAPQICGQIHGWIWV